MKKQRFESASCFPTSGGKSMSNGTPAVTRKPRGRIAQFTSACSLLIMALGFVARAWGDQSIELTWDASPSFDVSGYVVHYGGASRVYDDSLDVGDTTTATVRGLKEGTTYFFAVTAYDTGGLSSAHSEEISYQIPIAVRGSRVQIFMGPQTDAGAQLRFPASPGKLYELQTSADFQTWTTIWYSPRVTSMQWLEFEDRDTAGVGFYRLLVH